MRGIARLIALVSSLMLVLAACSDASSTSKGEVKVGGLEAAFAAARGTSSYRITQATGQTFTSSALGVNSTTQLDPDKPGVTGEVTPTGTHLKMDLAQAGGAVAPGVPDDVGFEIWADQRRVILDTRDYAALQKVRPGMDFGPFRPGVASIDLSQIAAGDSDLLAALAGQGVTDLEEMATQLPKVLKNVEQDGSVFTGTATYGALLAAMGGNVEQVAKSAGAAVALNLKVDAKDLARVYVDYYNQLPARVTVTVADGNVQSVRYKADLSGVFAEIFDRYDDLGIDASPAEIASARAALADTVLKTDVLITFAAVDGLELPVAPKQTEDRTDEWITYLRNAGF